MPGLFLFADRIPFPLSRQGLFVFAGFLILINLFGAVLIALDKSLAKRKLRRIRESVFFILALLGGGPGEWIAMAAVRHKTKHLSFVIGIPLLTILFYGILALLFFL